MTVDRIAILVAALLMPGIAHAAGTPEPASSCPAATHFTTVRLSRIKPGGSMAAFRKAEADQEAWYAAHKIPDHLFLAPVIARSDGKQAISDTTAMTFHVHLSDRSAPFPAHDAGWTAFVAALKANSDIVTTSHICLPG